MTTSDFAAVNDRIGRKRGPMTRDYDRIKELKMSDLRKSLTDSQDPEIVVGFAIQGLYDSINHLNALRMSNDTADYVLRDWRDMEVAEQMLSDLLHDLHMATRRAAE